MVKPFVPFPGAVMVLTIIAGCAVVPASHEPPNIYAVKQGIRAYVSSGGYTRDIAGVAASARSWIEVRAARGGGKLAVVFDLDETLISNWPEIGEVDFGYVQSIWNSWVGEGRAPAIEPVREVYELVRRLGVDIIVLTGRPERERADTEKNLHAIGCDGYALLLCEPDDSKETAASFKTAARARLETGGRVIIANIGDQESDLVGGHAERTFKLPNPFYLTE